MRTLGLVGGVTWHSTALYYLRLNTGVANALGPFRSADLLLRSLDYGTVRDAMASGDWKRFGDRVVDAAKGVRAGGAEAIVLCSNSLHGVAHRVEAEVGLPVLHIGDALADRALADGHDSVALFGTAFTMTQPFLKKRLRDRGLEVRVPEDIAGIDRIILQELAQGDVHERSRAAFVEALEPLIEEGATAVVLGCTELPLLIGPDDVRVPVLDTLELHVEATLQWVLQ